MKGFISSNETADQIKRELSGQEQTNQNEEEQQIMQNPVATMSIKGYGSIEIELYPQMAPNTVTNFIKLANNGFYDRLTIHRVEKDFVIQGGDPNGDGTGSPTVSAINRSIKKGSIEDIQYSINGEFTANGYNNTLKHERCTISMARSSYGISELEEEGYNSAGCQFFICLEDTPSLDENYAAFGKVINGMDIVDKLAEVELCEAEEEYITPSKPKKDIIISGIRVDTKGVDYGTPEIHEIFDYEKWYKKYYFGIE